MRVERLTEKRPPVWGPFPIVGLATEAARAAYLADRPQAVLFRGGRRVCVLAGGLCWWIGRSLLTAGAGPYDKAYNDQRRNNSCANNARIPIATGSDILIPISGWINIRRMLRTGIKRVLLGHWESPSSAF